MSPFERLKGAHLTSHPVIEDLVFSLLSLMVLVVAATVILSSQDPRIVAVAAPGGAAGAKQIVLYGTLVDTSGQPIANATIEVLYAKNNRIATTTTNASGVFDVRFNEATSPYTVRITTSQGTATTVLNMTGGMKWGLRITMAPGSNWVFVPLPGY